MENGKHDEAGKMARPIRIEYPGAVYHVASRGNARQDVFYDDEDREKFLEKLTSVKERYGLIIHAYCLMNNHYHIVVETPRGNLSKGMQRLNGDYTQDYNRRHERVGHLFQGRYKAVLIEKESHLLEVTRYVVLNPVRAKMVKTPAEWKWSSYKATAGMEAAPEFLFEDWILGRFCKKKAEAQRRYRQFVGRGIRKKGSPFDGVAAQIVLGSGGFLESCKDMLKSKGDIKEHPRYQRKMVRPVLEKIFSRNVISKDELRQKVKEAHEEHGYTLVEISEYLGVHYATAGRMLKMAKSDARK